MTKTYIAVLAADPYEFIHWVEHDKPTYCLNRAHLVADPPSRARTQEDCDAEPSYKYVYDREQIRGLRFKDVVVLDGFYQKPGHEQREMLEELRRKARRDKNHPRAG
jgi:hypothetical protein